MGTECQGPTPAGHRRRLEEAASRWRCPLERVVQARRQPSICKVRRCSIPGCSKMVLHVGAETRPGTCKRAGRQPPAEFTGSHIPQSCLGSGGSACPGPQQNSQGHPAELLGLGRKRAPRSRPLATSATQLQALPSLAKAGPRQNLSNEGKPTINWEIKHPTQG